MRGKVIHTVGITVPEGRKSDVKDCEIVKLQPRRGHKGSNNRQIFGLCKTSSEKSGQ